MIMESVFCNLCKEFIEVHDGRYHEGLLGPVEKLYDYQTWKLPNGKEAHTCHKCNLVLYNGLNKGLINFDIGKLYDDSGSYERIEENGSKTD